MGNNEVRDMFVIVLDYRNAKVFVMPAENVKTDTNGGILIDTLQIESQIEEWAATNNTALGDCEWMVWDGMVLYHEKLKWNWKPYDGRYTFEFSRPYLD